MDKPEKTIALPNKAPVFPLPNSILFPYADVPLYIFEPRYQKMLKDVLKGDRLICVTLIKEGWEEKKEPYPSYDICGIGMVKFAADHPDDTAHIILTGLARVKIKKVVRAAPYQIAEIERLNDKDENSNEVLALAEKVKDLFIHKVSLKKVVDGELVDSIRLLDDSSRIADIITYYSEAAYWDKQKVLECLDVAERLRLVIKILEDEIRILESKN